MSEFAKTKAGVDASEKKTLGEGLFRKCEACGDAVKKEDFARNHEVCPACGAHFHLPAEDWIALLADDGSWSAQDTDLVANRIPPLPGGAGRGQQRKNEYLRTIPE